MDAAMCEPIYQDCVDVDNYKAELIAGLSDVWKLAQASIILPIDRIQYCPSEVPEDAPWPPMKSKKSRLRDVESSI